MFHVMTRFGTTSLTASADSGLAKGTPPGALGPRSIMQVTITAPASNRGPLPNTVASPLSTPVADDVSRHEVK
ncbi:hypothetical protein GCM10010297_16500 [Streptomyces malachitofuscus]|nr:hypothetical protein GCM10010297_16500 [Streptomyces malachitofuscus]